ncbi:uncharacterized protein [Ptychodera flava]|uniref:uncharacterized protein n=1 Tax=Ptychodera flava TaxID=63121 RepID=UPI00396A72F5
MGLSKLLRSCISKAAKSKPDGIHTDYTELSENKGPAPTYQALYHFQDTSSISSDYMSIENLTFMGREENFKGNLYDESTYPESRDSGIHLCEDRKHSQRNRTLSFIRSSEDLSSCTKSDSIPYIDQSKNSLPLRENVSDAEKVKLSRSEHKSKCSCRVGLVSSSDVEDSQNNTNYNSVDTPYPNGFSCTNSPAYIPAENVRIFKKNRQLKTTVGLAGEGKFKERSHSDFVSRPFYSYLPHKYKVWNSFDHLGGQLFLPPTGLTLSVPEYALQPEKSQEIVLAVSGEKDDVPLLAPTEQLATWIVCVGPHGLQFQQPVFLRLPHCHTGHHGVTKVTVYCSETGLGQPKSWKKMPLVSDNLLCVIKPAYTLLLMQHFTWYTVTMETTPSPDNSEDEECTEETEDDKSSGYDEKEDAGGGDQMSGDTGRNNDDLGEENRLKGASDRGNTVVWYSGFKGSNKCLRSSKDFDNETDQDDDLYYPYPYLSSSTSGISSSSSMIYADITERERKAQILKVREMHFDGCIKPSSVCCNAFTYCSPLLSSAKEITMRLYLLHSDAQDSDELMSALEKKVRQPGSRCDGPRQIMVKRSGGPVKIVLGSFEPVEKWKVIGRNEKVVDPEVLWADGNSNVANCCFVILKTDQTVEDIWATIEVKQENSIPIELSVTMHLQENYSKKLLPMPALVPDVPVYNRQLMQKSVNVHCIQSSSLQPSWHQTLENECASLALQGCTAVVTRPAEFETPASYCGDELTYGALAAVQMLLDVPNAMSNDWQQVAAELDLKPTQLDWIRHQAQQNNGSPTKIVIQLWKEDGRSLQDLATLLRKKRRDDAATIIEDDLKKQADPQRRRRERAPRDLSAATEDSRLLRSHFRQSQRETFYGAEEEIYQLPWHPPMNSQLSLQCVQENQGLLSDNIYGWFNLRQGFDVSKNRREKTNIFPGSDNDPRVGSAPQQSPNGLAGSQRQEVGLQGAIPKRRNVNARHTPQQASSRSEIRSRQGVGKQGESSLQNVSGQENSQVCKRHSLHNPEQQEFSWSEQTRRQTTFHKQRRRKSTMSGSQFQLHSLHLTYCQSTNENCE